jgi:hypothetical protein
MLSREENELLTRVGAGTPMGTLMRRYWVPAVFSHQIAEPDSPPVRVRLLGEDLVAFRYSQGRVGLIDEAVATVRAALTAKASKRKLKYATSSLKIVQLKRKGRRVYYMEDGRKFYVGISGKKTKLTIAGKKAKASSLKVGMTYKVNFAGPYTNAKSVACD